MLLADSHPFAAERANTCGSAGEELDGVMPEIIIVAGVWRDVVFGFFHFTLRFGVSTRDGVLCIIARPVGG